MKYVIPVALRTVNPLNRREHHFQRARRVRKEHAATLAALWNRVGLGKPPALPLTIALVRVSPGVMDSDGAIAALKGVRDAVAEYLGVDDRDTPDLVWNYAQDKGPMGVRIEIEERSR